MKNNPLVTSIVRGRFDLASIIATGALICMTLVMFCGCATQRVEKTAADGTKTVYVTRAVFNKTAFSNVAVDKKTKTTDSLFSVGTYGAESQGDQLVSLFETLFNAGVQAGKKTIVP